MGATENPAAASFAEMLRHCRKAAGLSQEELAERSRVASRTISDLERGRATRPYRQTVTSLAAALDLEGAQRDQFVRLSRPGWEPTAADGHSQRATADGGAGLEKARSGVGQTDVPRQLPSAVSRFTGRTTELQALTTLISEAGGSRAVVISALAGPAGVGKTALAVHWAHQVGELFPDGQLYVNLRGYDPYEPVAPGVALAGFLQALGVPGQQIPDEVEDRARLYRSRLAGSRALVVLDNARDAEQVRPLLPGDPGCVTLITSRDRLAGLIAVDGARRLDLDVLPLADAIELLRSLIGRCADEDPEAAAELAGLCARLPLALRIAAELAASPPAAPLRQLVAELAASQLDRLNVGEARADVRAVFSWSVRQLPGDVAEAFALLGLHPGEDMDGHAAAALTGTTPGQAGQVLGRLHRASLIQATSPGRYGMHDLLRAYAREQAAARDTDGDRQRSLSRLVEYYLAGAVAATDVVFPADAGRRPPVAAPTMTLPKITSAAEAREWLDTERPNLTAIVVLCAGHGWSQHAGDLAGTLYRYLLVTGHLPEAQTIYSHALMAARRSGDVTNEGRALNGLGSICTVKGHGHDAVGYYRAALEAFRSSDDRRGQAEVLGNLAITEYDLRDYPAAVGYFRQAVKAYEDYGDRTGVARTLALLAAPEIEMGHYEDATAHLHRAMPVLEENSDGAYLGCALEQRGKLSLSLGQLAEAEAFFQQAIAIFRGVNYTVGAANALRGLSQVLLRKSDCQQATGYLREALALYEKAADRLGEILALRGLAEALHQSGHPAGARTELQIALRLAAETGNTYQQASTHGDLAENYQCTGESETARHHFNQAIDLYTEVGAPEADQIRARLDELPASGVPDDSVGVA
jgi:tetratricopeptide (TPR) repeat protein/transcriptional regulator with XRE-family HTH domain